MDYFLTETVWPLRDNSMKSLIGQETEKIANSSQTAGQRLSDRAGLGLSLLSISRKEEDESTFDG